MNCSSLARKKRKKKHTKHFKHAKDRIFATSVRIIR